MRMPTHEHTVESSFVTSHIERAVLLVETVLPNAFRWLPELHVLLYVYDNIFLLNALWNSAWLDVFFCCYAIASRTMVKIGIPSD